MLFTIFFALTLSQTKICICHQKCSPQCQNEILFKTTNSTFKKLISPYIDKSNEIEIDFYYEDDNNLFELDLKDFKENKIILKNCLNSKPIKVTIKNKNSFVEQISIKPNDQLLLPKYDISNIINNNKPAFHSNVLELPDKKYDDIKGLINATCDQINYVTGFAYCYKSGGTSGGSATDKKGDKANFVFNGSRICVVQHDQNNTRAGGVMQISIDGKVKGSSNLSTRTSGYIVVFCSEYLPFGEHTIELEQTSESGTFYINSFLVDPLPEVGGHVLGYDDIKENKGWTHDTTTNKTPFIKSAAVGSTMKFKFHGTRFWLTGIRDLSYGKCNLTIDNKETVTIDGQTGVDKFENDLKSRINGHQGVLLYESDVLEFKDHTITIENIDGKEFRINNLMYSTQPYNAIVVPSSKAKYTGNWTTQEDGHSTTIDGSKALITEYFNHFWIVGNKIKDNQALMNVYYNEEKKRTVNVSTVVSEFTNEILFTSDHNIPRGTYDVEVEKVGSSQEIQNEVLYINYFYYLNEKTITPTGTNTIINATQIPEENRKGPWEVKDDNLYTESNEASIIVNFFGNKFWIYGTTDPNYGKIDILIDDKKLGSVLLYSEKKVKNVIVYESPKGISVDEHKLEISNPKNKPISIYQFEYQVLPPTDVFSFSSEFTNSKDFTRSEKFSKSDYFSVSSHFTESEKFSVTSSFSESEKFSSTNDFTQTEGFTVSSAFSPSLLPSGGDVCMFLNEKGNYTKNDCRHYENEGLDDLIHVILTNFVDYIEENNGGAIYIINGGLDCESISFNHCVAKNGGGGSIYVKNTLDLVYNVTLLNVTAKDCRALYGGVGYIYIHSETNGIEIIGSAFENNTATQMKGSKESVNLFGGSHFFITAHNVNVMNSLFRKGVNNGGLKLYNVFDQGNKASMLDVGSQNHIFISGCNFELDEKSKNSIDYIDSHNRSKIEFVDCSFTGKLGKNSHYIEGKVGSKGTENVKISSCKFEYENEKAVSIGIFSKDQFIKADNAYEKEKSFGFIPLNSFMVLFSVALVISTLILLLLNFTKGQNDYENNANLFQ